MTPSTAAPFSPVLSQVPWAYRTAPCRALGLDFAVQVMDPSLGRYLDTILVHRHRRGPSDHLYSLLDRGPTVPMRYALFFDDAPVEQLSSPGIALAYLLWHINRAVIEHTPDLLLLHASAVESCGAAVLMPAPSESGKTTMAAGLVRAGMRYITDEAVAIEPTTVRVVPYPKALSVDRGSWDVLSDLRPQVDTDVEQYLDAQWHVCPDAIRPGAVAPTSSPRFIVAPRYERGATTTLVPIRRAEALSILVENAFNLDRHGAPGFYALTDVVRQSACFRLTIGDLDEACRVVVALVEQETRAGVAP